MYKTVLITISNGKQKENAQNVLSSELLEIKRNTMKIGKKLNAIEESSLLF